MVVRDLSCPFSTCMRFTMHPSMHQFIHSFIHSSSLSRGAGSLPVPATREIIALGALGDTHLR